MEEHSLINNTLVSIIIPVYNSQEYLAACINSALSQTWQNTEVIVIDDGSTDDSLHILKSFGNKITLLQQENKSASAARNYGLSVAKGEYVQFLDADDLLSNDKIAQQVTALIGTANKIAVCHTVHFFDEAEKKTHSLSPNEQAYIYTTDDTAEFMTRLWGGYDFHGWMVQTNAWLTPRCLIEKYGNWNENLTLDDDGEFFTRMVLNADGIIQTGGLNYYRKYQYSKKNLSSEKTKKGLESYFISILLKKKYLFDKSSSEFAKKAVYKSLTDLMLTCYITEPELYAGIVKELDQLPKYRYKVIIGGKLTNMVTRLLGWKSAKWLLYLRSKYINRNKQKWS